MDPKEALKKLRELAKLAIAVRDGNEPEYNLPDIATEMAEYFQALDEWIMSGGFLPKDWTRS